MSDAEELGILARLPSYDAIAYMVGRWRQGKKGKDGEESQKQLGALHVTTNWQDMWHEEHAQAFTISRLTRQDLLAAIHQGLLESVQGDLTRTDWMKNTEELLRKHRWWGRKEVRDRKQKGEKVATTFNPARLALIYDTNTRHAYAAGQWQRIQAAKHTHPYLRYVTRDDARVRDEHRAWHNVTLHVDDPWWDTHFPPNGWRCRCRVVPMSREDYERGVIEEKPQYHPGDSSSPIITRPLVTQAPSERTHTWRNPRSGQTNQVPEGIAPGFAYNVGKARGELAMLERLMEDKDQTLTPAQRARAQQTLRLKPDVVHEEEGQKKWSDQGLPDLRKLPRQRHGKTQRRCCSKSLEFHKAASSASSSPAT